MLEVTHCMASNNIILQNVQDYNFFFSERYSCHFLLSGLSNILSVYHTSEEKIINQKCVTSIASIFYSVRLNCPQIINFIVAFYNMK